MMLQSKFSLSQTLYDFIANYEFYGFKNKSSMVREALHHFKQELELQNLKRSADLYAEIYQSDDELQDLTEAAIQGWPE